MFPRFKAATNQMTKYTRLVRHKIEAGPVSGQSVHHVCIWLLGTHALTQTLIAYRVFAGRLLLECCCQRDRRHYSHRLPLLGFLAFMYGSCGKMRERFEVVVCHCIPTCCGSASLVWFHSANDRSVWKPHYGHRWDIRLMLFPTSRKNAFQTQNSQMKLRCKRVIHF